MRTAHDFDVGGLMKKDLKSLFLLIGLTLVAVAAVSIAGVLLFLHWMRVQPCGCGGDGTEKAAVTRLHSS